METAKLLLILSIVVIALWQISEVIFLVFAAILFAVLLRTLGYAIHRLTKIPMKWCVLLALITIVSLASAIGWILAPRVSEQLVILQETLPQSLQQFEDQITLTSWGQELFERGQGLSDRGSNQQLLSQTFGIFSSVIGVLASVAFVTALGVYIAIDPETYANGLVRLFPPARRARMERVLTVTGITLRRWLLGALLGMLTIGVLTTIGLWWLGVPLALTLGLLAGLLAFIPTFGPIISAVPAVLLALLQGPKLALYVVFLYLGVQFIESYLVTPFIQKRTIALAPALTIAAQVLMGLLFGFLGLLLATPILAVVLVLVKLLYLEDELGDKTHIPGRKKRPS